MTLSKQNARSISSRLKMNRFSIVLLTALVASIVTSLTVAFFQQHTISTLRQENARLTHG